MNENYSKGGDAGDVFIYARKIRGEGKITADGGDGTIGGKGGKINIITEENRFTGEISAKGGRSTLGNQETFWSKFFWYFIVGLIVLVLGGYILYRLGLS